MTYSSGCQSFRNMNRMWVSLGFYFFANMNQIGVP